MNLETEEKSDVKYDDDKKQELNEKEKNEDNKPAIVHR